MKKRRKIFKHLSLLMLTLSLVLSGIVVLPHSANVVYADGISSYVADDGLVHIVTGGSSSGCSNEIILDLNFSYASGKRYSYITDSDLVSRNFPVLAVSKAISMQLRDWANDHASDSGVVSQIRNGTFDYNSLVNSSLTQTGFYIRNHWSDFQFYFADAMADTAPSDPSKVKITIVPDGTTKTMNGMDTEIAGMYKVTVTASTQNNCTNYSSIYVPGCAYKVLNFNKSEYTSGNVIDKAKLTDAVFDAVHNKATWSGVTRRYNWDRVKGWAATTYTGKHPGASTDLFYDEFRKVYDGNFGGGAWSVATSVGNLGSSPNTTWLESMAYNYDGLNMGMWTELSSNPNSGIIVHQENDANTISVVIGTSSWLIFSGLNDNPNYYPTSVRVFDAFDNNSWDKESISEWGSGYGRGFPDNRMYSNNAGMGAWGRSINNHECCNYGTTHTFTNTKGQTQLGVWVLSPFITSGTNSINRCYRSPDGTQYGLYPEGSQPEGWVLETEAGRCGGGTDCTLKSSYVRVPWEWDFPNEKNDDVRAYAEVVANEIGGRYNGGASAYSSLAADWNVMQGIPSTENISIVSGGSSILFDIGGYDVLVGIAHDNVTWCDENNNKYANITHLNGAGAASEEAARTIGAPGVKLNDDIWKNLAVKRQIKINIDICHWWGEDNKPATLSCTGPHVLAEASESFPKGDPGDGDDGDQTEEGTCPLCGTEYSFTASGGIPTHEEDDGNGGTTTVDATANSWDGSHSCSYKLTFNCADGTYTYESDVDGDKDTTSYTPASHITASKQGYYSDEVSFTHGSEPYKSSVFGDPGTIDHGYTYGTGCHSDGHQNLYNYKNKQADYVIYECIDQYSYSRLTNYVLYGLTHNKITGYNEQLIDETTDDMSKKSGSALSVAVRGLIINTDEITENSSATNKPTKDDGHYESGNGRLWFTQNNFGWLHTSVYGGDFIDASIACIYANQSGAKTSDVKGPVAGANLLENNDSTHNNHFCLGNTKFVLGTFACDAKVGNDPNPAYVDDFATVPVKNRGQQEKRYYDGTGTLGNAPYGVGGKGNATTPAEGQDWKSIDLPYGDMCSEEVLKNQLLQFVNAWQNHMNTADGVNGLYTVTVVSDGLTAGFNNSGDDPYNICQKLCGNLSQIDYGIRLYNCGFSNVILYDGTPTISETHYRYHENLRSFDDTLDRAHEDADVGRWNTTSLQGYSGEAVEDLSSRYKKPDEYDDEVATRKWEEDYILQLAEQMQPDGSGGYEVVEDHILADCKIYSLYEGSDSRVYYGETQHTVGTSENYPYATTISPGETKTTGNFYVYTKTEEVNRNTETFEGYWRTHKYPNKGTYDIKQYVKGKDGSKTIATVTESGDLNAKAITDYGNGEAGRPGTPLVISNIKLKWNAPNKVYNEPVTVTNEYTVFLEVGKGGTIKPVSNKKASKPTYPFQASGKYSSASTINIKGVNKTSYECTYYKGYKNTANKSGVINDVVIHDPVASQYCLILPNNTGSYATHVVDETGEDFRISYSTLQNDDGTLGPTEKITYNTIPETNKASYIVMGNTFHISFSDVGDFADPSGQRYGYESLTSRGIGIQPSGNDGYGCSVETGEINKTLLGYVDRMNTSRWTRKRYVQFSFPVSYTDKEGKTKYLNAYTQLDLATVMARTNEGDEGYYEIDGADTDKNVTHAAIKEHIYRKASDAEGYTAGKLFHAPTAALKNYATAHGDTIAYGLDYEFTILTSALESTKAEVKFFSEAINTPADNSETITNTYGMLMDTNKIRSELLKDRDNNALASYGAYHRSDKSDFVEVVGRIGNLAIEDTADFRFSNLFKEALDTWLIPGVIRNTDITHPVNIISTRNDILGQYAEDTKNADGNTVVGLRHNTLSATSYLIGSANSKTNFQHGKAGPFYLLPLSSTYNPVPEYRKQLMRLGYNAYLDIETIGNYYGMNYNIDNNTVTRYRGPMNANETNTRKWDDDGDGNLRWTKKMTIIPHYYLYDPDERSDSHPYDRGFYSIDIYGGNSGDRSLVWSETNHIANPYELYIDLRSGDGGEIGGEAARRNVTNTEQFITNKIAKGLRNVSEDFTVFEDSDYIGTADLIELDYKDKSFIGTSWFNGAVFGPDNNGKLKALTNQQYGSSMIGENDSNPIVSLTPENKVTFGRIDPTSFGEQSQRWYFTLGLPSSSYLTSPVNIGRDQNAIEDSHKALLEAHPNGVVVVFLEVNVNGEVWQLEYDAVSQHGDDAGNISFEIPDLSDPTNPEPNPKTVILPKDPNSPEREDKDGRGVKINPTWVPVIVYDKEWNSTYDLATYGTH